MKRLDRAEITFRPLNERASKVRADRDMADARAVAEPSHSQPEARRIARVAERILEARRRGASVMLAFGAHTIKNGLGPLLIRLVEEGFVTHMATNGAGIIHDWELAYAGATSEDVRTNLAVGTFGNWHETGFYINLALAVGAWEGRGYGESIGAVVERERLDIPSEDELLAAASEAAVGGGEERGAAALALLRVLRTQSVNAGRLDVPHPWKSVGVQAAAYRHNVPLTGHPMFGHDIIYNHPANSGAAVGICAERDFLSFAGSVANLSGGVYLSVGSAVMSPMVFEKSLSMARNIAVQRGERIDGFAVQVVDLSRSQWDWGAAGEPPEDHPDYYLRYMKTFHRSGAEELSYICMDNREYFRTLLSFLTQKDSGGRRSRAATDHSEGR